MSLTQDLADFQGSIGAAGVNAPDEYDSWGYWTYETHMADLRELWAAIQPKLRRDLKQASWVDEKLNEMIAALDAGEKQKGRALAWELYRSDVKKLR